MKKIAIGFLTVVFAASLSFAQQQNPGDEFVKQRAALNSAKADLEDARQKRDMETASRWEDRETQNQERELFNEKYQASKETVDALMAERTRLMEDVRVAREDLSQVKAATEQARSEFLSLAAQEDRLEPLMQFRDQGVPFAIPERMDRFNRVKRNMELYKDDPLRVAKSLIELGTSEVAFTRQIEWKHGDLIFGTKLSYGDELRLGGVFAMQQAATPDGPAALMLPVPGEKGQVFSWQDHLSPEIKDKVKTAFSATSHDSSVVLVPVDVLLSTTLSSELANHKNLTWEDSFWNFMHDGGILMYPIMLLLVLGGILVVQRYVVLSVKSGTFRYRPVLKLCEEGKVDEARAKAEKLHGSVGKVIRAALYKKYTNRADAEKAIEEVFAAETPSIEKGLSSISIMATTAPLLGLLGTVMGMIELFKVITMHGTSDPKLLAGGISVALLTTEAGLIVAIPLQLCHTLLGNKADNLTGRMEKAGLAVLNALWIKERT